MIADSPRDVNAVIAAQVRELRARQGLSLEALAERCGVSRSMISLIERAEASPTAVVLEKLATGLQVPLASLFDQVRAAPVPVSRADEQVAWRDPASGYLRRNVSPAGFPSPLKIIAVAFPPRARVSYETAGRDVAIHQQIWVLEGSIDITVGTERHRLHRGDCLAMVLDRPILYQNPTRKLTRYAVIIATAMPGGA
jgi:transcriptional regulator with XRE-family HTH domain